MPKKILLTAIQTFLVLSTLIILAINSLNNDINYTGASLDSLTNWFSFPHFLLNLLALLPLGLALVIAISRITKNVRFPFTLLLVLYFIGAGLLSISKPDPRLAVLEKLSNYPNAQNRSFFIKISSFQWLDEIEATFTTADNEGEIISRYNSLLRPQITVKEGDSSSANVFYDNSGREIASFHVKRQGARSRVFISAKCCKN